MVPPPARAPRPGEPMKKPPPKPLREFGRYGSVGIELVLSIVLGYYGGHWLDGKIAGGHGWLTAFGSLLGVYAGFRSLFLTAALMQRDIERSERQERGEDPWGSTNDRMGSTKDARDPEPRDENDDDRP